MQINKNFGVFSVRFPIIVNILMLGNIPNKELAFSISTANYGSLIGFNQIQAIHFTLNNDKYLRI
jgi:hypothetical protein